MPRILGLSVILLAVAGGLVRGHGIADPLVSFHPLRHYRSALIARACFYEHSASAPPWAVEIARANRDIQQAGEPPFMEAMACAADLMLGRETALFPRWTAVMWWLVATWPVVIITRRLASNRAAMLAAALHLFLPFAIVATRTFQPDPLMTTCALAAVAALLEYHDRPTRRALVVAGGLSGLALLVKPMSVFVVIPAFVAIVAERSSARVAVRDRRTWVLLAIASLAPVLYYGHSLVFGRLAQDQLQTRFVPSLLTTAFFWHGLARTLNRVAGWPIVALAVAAMFVARERLTRRVFQSLGLGYAAFAVAFTYHVPTHDYYSLPFLPVLSMAAAATLDRFLDRVAAPIAQTFLVTACAAVCVLGTWRAWPQLTRPGGAEIVADYERIGEVSHHDGRVLFLDLEYGYPLMYHAEIAGDAWPGIDDLEAERLDGRPVITAAERWARDYADWRPHYFVATDMESLRKEPDLQALLAEKATLIDETRLHRVYKFGDGGAARVGD